MFGGVVAAGVAGARKASRHRPMRNFIRWEDGRAGVRRGVRICGGWGRLVLAREGVAMHAWP